MAKDLLTLKIAQSFNEERYSKTKVNTKIRQILINNFEDYLEKFQIVYDAIHNFMASVTSETYYAKQRRAVFLHTWLSEKEKEGVQNPELEILFAALMPMLQAQYKRQKHNVEIPIQQSVLKVAGLIHVDTYEAYHPKFEKYLPYTKLESRKLAAELITVMCESDLYDINLPAKNSYQTVKVVPQIKLSNEDIHDLNETKYIPPMICKPRPVVENNNGAGYLTIKESVILNKFYQGDQPVNLGVLNILNAIPLSLDENILKLPEVSNKPLDTKEKVEAFELWKETSRTVYKNLVEDFDNKFYLTNKYDSRGRFYTQGYHVNIQSFEYKKALINFHKKELII